VFLDIDHQMDLIPSQLVSPATDCDVRVRRPSQSRPLDTFCKAAHLSDGFLSISSIAPTNKNSLPLGFFLHQED
jgi:hypothetical protein